MKPVFFFDPRFPRLIALLIIGILLGSILTTLAIGYHLDNLNSANRNLQAELSEKEDQIKTLEDKLSNSNKYLVVNEITIQLELPERDFADQDQLKIDLEEAAKKIVKNIRGKKVKDLDPQVVWNIIDQRNISVSGYSFIFEVRGVMISEKLMYYIFARYVEPVKNIEPM